VGFVVILSSFLVPATSYKLTPFTLAALRAEDVSEDIIAKLAPLEGREETSRELFRGAVRSQVGGNYTESPIEDRVLAWAQQAPWRFPVVAVGLLLVAAAVSLRLSFAPWAELEDRTVSAGLVALGGLACILAAYSLDPSWDSIKLLLSVGFGVALAGALLILLPPLTRRLALTVLVVVHFGGIFTAVFSVAPPASAPPFIVTGLWTYFYRNYLQFMYLNNAYHFYSPDPGPPSMLWFAIKYDKGAPRWVTLPAREQYRTRQDYQRYLALCEYTNMVAPGSPPGPVFQMMWQKRNELAGKMGFGYGPDANTPPAAMFRMPTAYSKKVIASYARYAATHFPSSDPEGQVVSVRVYRVQHTILQPSEMNGGKHPLARDTYLPYFMGEFDPNGKLVRDVPSFTATGELDRSQPDEKRDYFLYWALPSEARYKITDKTLAKLEERHVPRSVLDKLRRIKGSAGSSEHEYPSSQFLGQLGHPQGTVQLDPEEQNRFLGLILTFSPSDTYSGWEFAERHAGFLMKDSEKVYGPSPGH
jgi:hypothetical protein